MFATRTAQSPHSAPLTRHRGQLHPGFRPPERHARSLISDAFADLVAALTTTTIEDLTDPVDRLRAGCATYLEFADARSQQYRVLFQHRRPVDLDADVYADQMIGARAFSVLVDRIADCVAAGRSRSIDPFADAATVWVALHGYTTLHTAIPNFPWPDRHGLLDRIVLTLAKIDT